MTQQSSRCGGFTIQRKAWCSSTKMHATYFAMPAFTASAAWCGVANRPDEFAAFLRDERVKWAKGVKPSGAKVD